MAIKSISLDNIVWRSGLLIAGGLLCVLAVYFAVKWCVANTVANTLAVQTDSREIAEFAAYLAPNDPKTHFALAALYEKAFSTEDFEKSLEKYEFAVSLAPNDFRLWFDLAKARDRQGDANGAEKAYRKAAELAPNYSRVHWALGNLLLRRGNTEEAFLEIRKAVENDPNYANPAVNVAWQFFDGDIQLISQKIGDSIPIKSSLSAFLAGQKRFDEAFTFWNALSPEEKRDAFREQGEALFRHLMDAGKYHEALSVHSQINQTDGEKFEVGKIHNPGFETNVKTAKASPFEWSIADGLQPQIGFDGAQKRGGSRSLVIVFNSLDGRDFRNIEQTVAVESGKRYVFETFARADLKTQATVKWEIVDTASRQVAASTDAIPANSDWIALRADFNTSPATKAVIIRLARADCPNMVCPITGKAWFDDFSLK
jgi:hypothetical protein